MYVFEHQHLFASKAVIDLLTKGNFGEFCAVTCPELADISDLIAKPETIFQLMEMVCSAKENVEFQFNAEALEGLVPAAERTLKLIRSCTILHFLAVICLVFSESKGDWH